jgi:hypothetical protein
MGPAPQYLHDSDSDAETLQRGSGSCPLLGSDDGEELPQQVHVGPAAPLLDCDEGPPGLGSDDESDMRSSLDQEPLAGVASGPLPDRECDASVGTRGPGACSPLVDSEGEEIVNLYGKKWCPKDTCIVVVSGVVYRCKDCVPSLRPCTPLLRCATISAFAS